MTNSRECAREVWSKEVTHVPKWAAKATPEPRIINTVFFSVRRLLDSKSISRYCQIAKGNSIRTVICRRQEARIKGGIESTCDRIAPADDTPRTPATSNPHTSGGVRLIEIIPQSILHLVNQSHR